MGIPVAEDGLRFWSVLKMILKLQFGTYCLRRIFPKYRDFSTGALRKALEDPSEPLSRLPQVPHRINACCVRLYGLKVPKRQTLGPVAWWFGNVSPAPDTPGIPSQLSYLLSA